MSRLSAVVCAAVLTLSHAGQAHATCVWDCVGELVKPDCTVIELDDDGRRTWPAAQALYLKVVRCQESCTGGYDPYDPQPPTVIPYEISASELSVRQIERKPYKELPVQGQMHDWTTCDGKPVFRFDGGLQAGRDYVVDFELQQYTSMVDFVATDAPPFESEGGCSMGGGGSGACGVALPLLLGLGLLGLGLLARRRHRAGSCR